MDPTADLSIINHSLPRPQATRPPRSTRRPLHGRAEDSLTAFSRDDFISYGTSLASEWTGSVTVDVCGLCGLEAADMAEAMNKKVEDRDVVFVELFVFRICIIC